MDTPRLAVLVVLAASLGLAGCVKEGALSDASTEEESVEPAPSPATPAPVSAPPPARPTSPPPSSTPPATTPTPAAPTEPAPAAPAPRITVLAWNGTLTGAGVSASTPGGEICCASATPANENADVEFDVPAGLKGIVVELAWTDTQFDLDLLAAAPDYDPTPAPPAPYTGHRWLAAGGAPGQPEGRATIAIVDEAALALTGGWGVHASPKGPANAVAFALYVSLFHDEAPASGYTAVPSGNP